MERSRCVDAVSSPAEPLVPLALVHIHADLHHGRRLEPSVALACERAGNVDARPVAAHTVHDVTLVDVHTLDAVFVQGVAAVKQRTIISTCPFLCGHDKIRNTRFPDQTDRQTARACSNMYASLALSRE